jgi:hypothetical protein
MSSFDFVPRTDADFNIWQTSVNSISPTNATAWGIPAAEITALMGLQNPWNNTFVKAANKHHSPLFAVQLFHPFRVQENR